MNFKIKIIYLVGLIVSFSQIASSAVERIDFRRAELSVNEIEAERYCANAALARAGIGERITNEPFNAGGFGKVFYTPNYAVKVSQGEYVFGLNNAESSRLINVKNQIQANAPAGVKFCLPQHVYKGYLDGRTYVLNNGKVVGTNIQIMPRIRNNKSIGDIAVGCIKHQDARNMSLMQNFGEKMGQFQNWGLVQKPGSTPDVACMHGDLNPENVLVTNWNLPGVSTQFTFIDNADYSNPQLTVGGGGSLVSDLTYLTYKYVKNALGNGCHSWENGLEQTLQSFYKGYIPQLPKEVCQKLLTNLYGNPQECLAQAKRDVERKYEFPDFIGSYSIPNIQARAFQAAFRAAYPAAPAVVFPRNAPVVQPVLNRAQQKQLIRQQKAQQKAAVKAQKAQQKQLARQQKAAVKAQKAAQKNAVKAQKSVQKALKAAAKRNRRR